MLHVWMEENWLLYGMILAGVLGCLCITVVNRFYGQAIRDLRRMPDPKGKWTKEFLREYQLRQEKEQEITNPEVFIRSQMVKGKSIGIGVQKWKQGIGVSAILCFLLMMSAIYGTYRYEATQLMRYQYILVGAGIFSLLLLMKQFMGFMNQEDTILDGLMDYLENSAPSSHSRADLDTLREEAREELITRVSEGIQQTAASETKFSHMLTPEEEKIMREVIREYMI